MISPLTTLRAAAPVLAGVAVLLFGAFLYYKGYSACQLKVRAQMQEKVIENVQKEAQSWANRPASVDAAIDRVRRAADARRKNNP
jgi:hypothetical protein